MIILRRCVWIGIHVFSNFHSTHKPTSISSLHVFFSSFETTITQLALYY